MNANDALQLYGWPAWAVTWGMALAIFAFCKGLTWLRAAPTSAPWWQHMAYLVAWPGLDAKRLLRTERLPPEQRPTRSEWLWAVTKCGLGCLLFWRAAATTTEHYTLARGWVGMIGLVMMLHFGLLHGLSCL